MQSYIPTYYGLRKKLGSAVLCLLAFPRGKQPYFPLHCIGTRQLSNLIQISIELWHVFNHRNDVTSDFGTRDAIFLEGNHCHSGFKQLRINRGKKHTLGCFELRETRHVL